MTTAAANATPTTAAAAVYALLAKTDSAAKLIAFLLVSRGSTLAGLLIRLRV